MNSQNGYSQTPGKKSGGGAGAVFWIIVAIAGFTWMSHLGDKSKDAYSGGTTHSIVTSASPYCTNGSYINTAGNTVCRPAASPSVPAGASAQCRDGTYSYSQSRRGTCSHHGGVAQWL